MRYVKNLLELGLIKTYLYILEFLGVIIKILIFNNLIEKI